MKQRLGLVIAWLSLSLVVQAEAFAHFGVDSVKSELYREWYQQGELQHYLDNYSDYVLYQTETTGDWGLPEQMIFSVQGNSWKWNKYYVNGFRVDSRFLSGNMLYRLDLMENSLALDYHRGILSFETDDSRLSRVSLTGNVGGLGGLFPGMKEFHEAVSHAVAVSRLYPTHQAGAELDSRATRMHQIGTGQLEAVYGIKAFGQTSYWHAYANYGMRQHLKLDYQGLCGTFNADYFKVQLDGRLPLPKNEAVDDLYFIFSMQQRGDMYSEFYYNYNELAKQRSYNASMYGKKDWNERGELTTGLTFAYHEVSHNELEFERNLVDQDGESFEPWYADGKTAELNWSLNYDYRILPWLSFNIDGFNTYMHFSPTVSEWHNDIYYQNLSGQPRTDLYRYNWEANAFSAGMLENAFSLNAEWQALPWLTLSGMAAFTVDGMILGHGKSLVTPSWEAMVGIHMQPCKWFQADVVVGNYRTRYSYDQVLFMSDDYMNANVNYAHSGSLLTTTGGKYHQWDKGLQQPQYFMLDIPFRFTIAERHEISILTSVKKYYNTWTTVYTDPAYDQGVGLDCNEWDEPHTAYQVYTMPEGEKHYRVTQAPLAGDKFLFNTPFFASNEIKYAYNGKKVFFSLGWQSLCVSGVSAFGSGVISNDIYALSESTARINNTQIDGNMHQPNASTRSLGRLDQDKAFILRMQLGVNITQNWQLTFHGKFRDGTPFNQYVSRLYTNEAGDTQAVLWNACTRGDNPADANFGERKDSFFNFDLRLRYRGLIKGVPFSAEVTCYNLFDLGTELNEYTFDYFPETGKDLPGHRYALQLCVPRGLNMKVCVGLEKQ